VLNVQMDGLVRSRSLAGTMGAIVVVEFSTQTARTLRPVSLTALARLTCA
jgi:hypothetical protein